MIFLQSGKMFDMARACEDALTIDDTDTDSLCDKAMAYLRENKFEEGKHDYHTIY